MKITNKSLIPASLISSFCLTVSFSVSAITIIDENAYGDFANVQFENTPIAPTDLGVFTNDTYIINGQVGLSNDQADTFTFSIADGYILQNVYINNYNSSLGFDDSHLYMNRGANLSYDQQDEVEFINFSAFSIGTDLLQFDSAPGSQEAGNYTIQWKENEGPANYEMQLVISAIPIPAAFWLMASGVLGLIGIARRTSFKPE